MLPPSGKSLRTKIADGRRGKNRKAKLSLINKRAVLRFAKLDPKLPSGQKRQRRQCVFNHPRGTCPIICCYVCSSSDNQSSGYAQSSRLPCVPRPSMPCKYSRQPPKQKSQEWYPEWSKFLSRPGLLPNTLDSRVWTLLSQVLPGQRAVERGGSRTSSCEWAAQPAMVVNDPGSSMTSVTGSVSSSRLARQGGLMASYVSSAEP